MQEIRLNMALTIMAMTFLMAGGIPQGSGSGVDPEPRTDPSYLQLLSADPPISIESDEELALEADRGSGTTNDPYVIENRSIIYESNYCILIKNITKNLRIYNCSVRGSNYYQEKLVIVVDSSNLTFDNMNISYGVIGIMMDRCEDIVFNNNFINHSMIRINNSKRIHFINSTSRYESELDISNLTDMVIASNIFENTRVVFYDLFEDSTSNPISNNFFSGRSSLIFNHCSAKIYNNRFDTNNLTVTNSTIRWSTNKKLCKNIVGGPYCFGNYWFDYEGKDLDGDGIGDTMLPHHGDYGPLVEEWLGPDTIPPIAYDVTEGRPETGRNFAMAFDLFDNRDISGVRCNRLEYSIKRYNSDISYHGFLSFSKNGSRLDTEINVSSDAVQLKISLQLSDFSGNMAWYDFEYDVLDVIPPSIRYPIGCRVNTEGWTIFVEYSDNIQVSSIQVEYRFDDGPIRFENASLSGLSGHKGVVFKNIPNDAIDFHYRVTIFDHAGLQSTSPWMNKTVADGTKPEVEVISQGLPETGRPFRLSFRITDNREIASVDAEASLYGFDDDGIEVIPDLDNGKGNIWSYTMSIPEDAYSLWYRLIAIDREGNERYFGIRMDVVDVIPPTIEIADPGEPSTGDVFDIRFSVKDNRRVNGGFFEYGFDTGDIIENVTGIPDRYSINISIEATVLHIRIGAVDGAGNWNIVNYYLKIKDTIKPSVSLLYADMPKTSHNFTLVVDAVDNIHIKDIELIYSFNGIEYILKGNGREFSIPIPDDATSIFIVVKVKDGGDNEKIENLYLEVEDATPPKFGKCEILAFGKDRIRLVVNVSDNRKINWAWAIVEDGGKNRSVDLVKGMDGRYHASLWTDDLDGDITITFFASDQSGNIGSSEAIPYHFEKDHPSMALCLCLGSILLILIVLTLAGFTIYRRRRNDFI